MTTWLVHSSHFERTDYYRFCIEMTTTEYLKCIAKRDNSHYLFVGDSFKTNLNFDNKIESDNKR